MKFRIVYKNRRGQECYDGLEVDNEQSAWRHCHAVHQSTEFLHHPEGFVFLRLERRNYDNTLTPLQEPETISPA